MHSYNIFFYGKKGIKQVNILRNYIYYIKMLKKNNILKMDYNKKKNSFAYLMWSILKKKKEPD